MKQFTLQGITNATSSVLSKIEILYGFGRNNLKTIKSKFNTVEIGSLSYVVINVYGELIIKKSLESAQAVDNIASVLLIKRVSDNKFVVIV